ncbi:MAG: phosphatase PAP2 family protein [Desulfitobacterium hafniense]|nr:phosphatase PAP2 family protein [Desulfitobacterium hafniense]
MGNISGNKKPLYQSPLRNLELHLIFGIIAGLLLIILFAKLSEDLLCQELGSFDTVAGIFIRSYNNDSLTNVAILITQLGSAYIEIGLLLAVGSYLLFRLKHVWEAMILSINLAGGWLLNLFLKVIFHRTRPDIQHLVKADGYSFPSGHAMISATFYGMLGYLLWLNFREHSIPSWYVPVLTVGLIITIGVSRIYLGVHYPSDVIAGFAAGGVWLIACILGLHAIRHFKNIK